MHLLQVYDTAQLRGYPRIVRVPKCIFGLFPVGQDGRGRVEVLSLRLPLLALAGCNVTGVTFNLPVKFKLPVAASVLVWDGRPSPGPGGPAERVTVKWFIPFFNSESESESGGTYSSY